MSNDTQPELDLDLPPLVPVWPRPWTIHSLLLETLIEDGRITVDEFQQATGSHEARKVISDLRDLGWPIDSHTKAAPKPLIPKRHIALYVLNSHRIDFTKVARP